MVASGATVRWFFSSAASIMRRIVASAQQHAPRHELLP
jgi:hypothetical protein